MSHDNKGTAFKMRPERGPLTGSECLRETVGAGPESGGRGYKARQRAFQAAEGGGTGGYLWERQ